MPPGLEVTHAVAGGLQRWHRSAAKPDALCIGGRWEAVRQEPQEAGKSRVKNTSGEKNYIGK